MSKSRSKAKRREIARHISRKRFAQPGYAELAFDRENMLRKRILEIQIKEGEIKERETLVFTRSLVPRIAYFAAKRIDQTAELLIDRLFLTLLCYAAVAYLFGLSDSTIALLKALGLLALVRCVAAIVVRVEKFRCREELQIVRREFNEWIEAREHELETEYTARCDAFVGYPPDWNDRRSQVLKRDDYTCQSCFSSSTYQELHVHHVVEVAHGGRAELSNLITLCNRCHGKVHGRSAK